MRVRHATAGWIALILLALTGCQPTELPPTRSGLPPPATASPQAAATATIAPTRPAAVNSATATAAPGAQSGIQIKAVIGPTCPGAQKPGQVCDQPYAGTFTIQDTQGTEVARVVTDDLGQATSAVPPGRYIVALKVEGRFPRGAPVEVTVNAGQIVTVQITLDSGIR